MLASLERLGEPGEGPGRLLLSKVRPIAEELAAALREHPAANRVEVAGSVRRWAETCKDIDLIATAEEPAALAEHLAAHPLIAAAGNPGPERRARADPQRRSRSTCGSSPPEAFGNLLQHFTGSAGPQRAAARGRGRARASRSPSTASPTPRAARSTLCATEEEVYERLGYAYIEPELREGRGELKAAREGKLPELVDARRHPRRPALPHHPLRRPQHARGDGRGGPRARLRLPGDHRPLRQPRLRRPRHRRAALGADRGGRAPGTEGKRGFRLLAGSEINIGLDGALDYPDDLVAALDWVVASVHTSFSIAEKEMTERVLAAIENPQVDCIGHLTGRLIGRREPYGIDVEAVAEAAAAHRHDARDQRQPQPPRPLRAPRPPRRRRRRHDRPQHRRPRRRHARQHGLRASPPPAAPG